MLSLHKGKLVEDQTVLSDVGVEGRQTVQVEIQSADPVDKSLKYTRVSPTYKLPDKVNVEVEIGKLYFMFQYWLLLYSVNLITQLTVFYLFLFVTDNIIIREHQSHETSAVLETCQETGQAYHQPTQCKSFI